MPMRNIIFALYLLFSSTVFAGTYKSSSIDFDLPQPGSEHIYYSLSFVDNDKLSLLFSEVDTLGMASMRGVRLVATKVYFEVNKPIDFFASKNVNSIEYNKRTLNASSVRRLGPSKFRVFGKGIFGFDYTLESFRPSLASYYSLSAKRDFEKNEIILINREYTNYSRFSKAGVALSLHYPLSSSRTAIITYGLIAIDTSFAIESIIEGQFTSGLKVMKSENNSF